MVVFANMVDISALNTFIVYMFAHGRELGRTSGRRRKVLIKLGKELAGLEIEKCEQNFDTTSSSSQPLNDVDDGAIVDAMKKKCCYKCPKNIGRMSKIFCQKCNQNICKEHRPT